MDVSSTEEPHYIWMISQFEPLGQISHVYSFSAQVRLGPHNLSYSYQSFSSLLTYTKQSSQGEQGPSLSTAIHMATIGPRTIGHW